MCRRATEHRTGAAARALFPNMARALPACPARGMLTPASNLTVCPVLWGPARCRRVAMPRGFGEQRGEPPRALRRQESVLRRGSTHGRTTANPPELHLDASSAARSTEIDGSSTPREQRGDARPGAAPIRNARHQIERDEPERPDVGRGGDVAERVRLLGRHVARGADGERAGRAGVAGHQLGDTEVEDLGAVAAVAASRLGEEDVLRLEVAMHDACGGEVEGMAAWPDALHARASSRPPFSSAVRQVLAAQELHPEERVPVRRRRPRNDLDDVSLSMALALSLVAHEASRTSAFSARPGASSSALALCRCGFADDADGAHAS